MSIYAFDWLFHDWYEPFERALDLAKQNDVTFRTPKLGQESAGQESVGQECIEQESALDKKARWIMCLPHHVAGKTRKSME
ncbi:hypothetical protein HC752_09420 [Vibrio sp. S9_S30]|uniref:hypothetical protein n=1 Tax=Vibrio sp. S9_S30 TaxID=2720226 RepID=UPI0016812639|nr:hypothetical protein [Vibrio sp. S9_S30]MBD1557159.1 hypothetical protein [Vibrio sp. S9_S30]